MQARALLFEFMMTVKIKNRLALLLCCLLWALAAQSLSAQTPTPSPSAPIVLPTPVFPNVLPTIISAPFRSEPGALASLRGLPLFRLQSTREITGQDRADLLEKRLNALLEDSEQPLDVEVKRNKDGIYLSSRDSSLIAIHDADTEAAQTTSEALAIHWCQILEQNLGRVRREQGAEFLEQAAAIVAASILLWLLLDRLIRRLALRYLQTTGFSLRLLQGLVWTSFICWQFPAARPMALAVERYAILPLMILLSVVFGGAFTSYLLGRAITHYFRQVELTSERAPQAHPRWRQRLHMLRQVAAAVTNSLVVILAVVIFFSLLDVNLGALLAGASFLGVGLGLAAQNILKDWIAGVNIVLEDQFGDGDLISADGIDGVVEHFTLRITQLRDMSGNLITIPNSHIQVVKNLSNLWSQVDLSIPISYRADLRRALEILEAVARQLAQDWPERLQGNPQMLGIEELGSYFVRLRMLQRTAPQQQFAVRRELLLRIKEAFDLEGMEIPIQEMAISHKEPSRQVTED